MSQPSSKRSLQTSSLNVDVWRGDSNGGQSQTFEVPREPSQTVLDVVTWIQRNADPDLSYRFACRVGMCGSCAMMVNGVPRWTCRTHVERVAQNGQLSIAPLRNLPVIKDLACDMSEFFEKWQKSDARFHPSETRHDDMPRIDPHEKQRSAANAAIECINCAVCYSACDVVNSSTTYAGPAALNRAWTLQNDQRDSNRASRLQTLVNDSGCTSCHSLANCSVHCPVELNPSGSIAGLKRMVFSATLKGQL
ncbi:MAG: 2Fe-2S iron-sulfur cluster-binding protein [Pseudomonadota bacterium]